MVNATTHNCSADRPQIWLKPLRTNIHNQDIPLLEQLRAGIRGVKINVHAHEGEALACHGLKTKHKRAISERVCGWLGRFSDRCRSFFERINPCSVDPATRPLEELLTEIKRYVDEAPRVVLTLFLEDHLHDFEDLQRIFKKTGLESELYVHSRFGSQWPNLGEMIGQHSRIVVFVDSDHNPDSKGRMLEEFPQFLSFKNNVWSTRHRFANAGALENDQPFEEAPNREVRVFQHFTTRFLAGDPKDAAVVNSAEVLEKRLYRYVAKFGLFQFLWVDFFEYPLDRRGVLQLVDEINDRAIVTD